MQSDLSIISIEIALNLKLINKTDGRSLFYAN